MNLPAELLWLLQAAVGLVLVVIFGFIAFVIGFISIHSYRDWLGHRDGAIPAWGPKRIALVMLPVIGALAWHYDAVLWTRVVLGLFALLCLPTVINMVSVVLHGAQGLYFRARGRVHNPLLTLFEKFYAENERDTFPPPRVTRTYAWVVPSQQMLDVIKKYGPIVEVGAGTGYIAWLLRQMGVSVIAYDALPGPCIGNRHHAMKLSWTYVRKGDAEGAARRHSDRTLLICWPPAETDMSTRALQEYSGETVIYIGAVDTGCGADTGHDSFHRKLKSEWTLVEKVALPTWTNRYRDYIRVYRRRVAE